MSQPVTNKYNKWHNSTIHYIGVREKRQDRTQGGGSFITGIKLGSKSNALCFEDTMACF